MLTFKEFLSEKVDPVALAHRAARIHGKHDADHGWLKAKKHTYIPLKQAPDHEVEHAMDKYGEVEHKVKQKTSTLKIKDLHATQPFNKVEDHDKLRKKLTDKHPHIHVVTHKGKHYIDDGHHAVMAARLNGHKEVTVKHTNLDEH